MKDELKEWVAAANAVNGAPVVLRQHQVSLGYGTDYPGPSEEDIRPFLLVMVGEKTFRIFYSEIVVMG